MFEQVHLDVGPAPHRVGPVRARAVLEEATEISPYHEPPYSSDGFGPAEFHRLGALACRRGPGEGSRTGWTATGAAPPTPPCAARAGRERTTPAGSTAFPTTPESMIKQCLT